MSKIKLKVKADRKLYYDNNSMFGVYALSPIEKTNKIELNNYGNFVVNGSTPELIIGNTYEIEIEPSRSSKYGDGYVFISIMGERPTTLKEQREYVQLASTEKQYKEILKIYPNELLLDLFESDKFDYTLVKGMSEKSYDNLKAKLLDNFEVQEVMLKLKDMEFTSQAAKRLVSHFGSATMVIDISKKNIYRFCEVKLFGFKKVDEYAMKRGDSPTSKARIIAATLFALEQDANNGHSWMYMSDLEEQLRDLLKIDTQIINTILNGLKTNQNGIKMVDNKVGLEINYFYESEIKNKLELMMNTPCKTVGIDEDEKIKELEQQNGFTYTDEQREAIRKAINSNVLVLNGLAGSGKSSVVKGILRALNDYTYHCSALSGKAALILSKQGLESSTIHRMLGIDKKTGGFAHNKETRLPYDVVVLDESSMANNYLIYSIVIALKDDAKIIFVGDNGQLPSIGTGAVFDDLLSIDVFPRQELTKVHRQAQKSGILTSANKIRSGNQINDRYSNSNETLGELKDMLLMPVSDKTEIKDMILSICKKYKHGDLNEFQVITGMKERGDICVRELNLEMQQIFNDMSKKSINYNGYGYREGDKVIHNGNNYQAKTDKDEFDMYFSEDDEEKEDSSVAVFNGTLGKIVKIEFDPDNSQQNHTIYIKFENIEDLIVYQKDELKFIDLAYALTVHRVQGSTIKHVVFAFDYGSYMLLSREFVYTGVTRASEGCILIAENRALHYAIEKTSGNNRRTFLKDMLIELRQQ